MEFYVQVTVRVLLAVAIGAVIGGERERHGRAAGMRTHILVCLGSALTSLISIYMNLEFGSQGDMLRLSAQVISGIGFLGAGMIILKRGNVISGLTTAAGVWTTGILGIAAGYGFYLAAVLGTVLFLITTALLTRFERRKKKISILYIEIDDMYSTNEITDILKELLECDFNYKIVAPISGYNGHLGISVDIRNKNVNLKDICAMQNVVFVKDESEK